MKQLRQIAIILLNTAILLFVTLEVGVRSGVLIDPTLRPDAQRTSDPLLEYRLVPFDTPDIDARGWRNRRALESATVVVVGDSQTYGTSTSREQAYPQQLQRLIDAPVYNMGLGGYGPVQYSALLDEALELEPETVVFGFYAGNDLVNCYSTATTLPSWESLLDDSFDYTQAFDRPELSYSTIMDHIRNGNLEAARQLAQEVEGTAAQVVLTRTRQSVAAEAAAPGSVRQQVRDVLFRSKAFSYVYFTFVRPFVRTEADRQALEQSYYDTFAEITKIEDAYVTYRDDDVFIQFTPAVRAAVQNTDDPIVAEGRRICTERFIAIHEECEAANVACPVALIPTKEMVYEPYLNSQGYDFPPYYRAVIDNETQWREQFIEAMEQAGVEVIDLLPPMQASATELAPQGILLYPSTSDGHPNRHGNRAIAEALNTALTE